jgi:RNase P subunit RPR2
MDGSIHYVLDPEVHGGSEVLKLLTEGKHPLCPRCKTPLIVALTPEAAKAQQQNPGMRCPVSISHFQSTAYFR